MPAKKKNVAPRTGKAPQSSELTLIKSLADILNETGLTEIELDHKGARVRVSKAVTMSATVASHAPLHHQATVPHVTLPAVAAAATAPTTPSDHAGTLKSPMVGTAYLAPSPGAPDFITVGASVKEGQTLLIIEAMKTMNQIVATRSGTVTQILIENGQPVEYGETLLVIE
jgi:acetyl-CoA carboxylase biotin carboxyl carrier protein